MLVTIDASRCAGDLIAVDIRALLREVIEIAQAGEVSGADVALGVFCIAGWLQEQLSIVEGWGPVLAFLRSWPTLPDTVDHRALLIRILERMQQSLNERTH